jgi:heme oxygenase
LQTNAPASGASVLFDRLRAETRAHHDRAEQFISIPQSIDALVAQLTRFYTFMLPWENAVERHMTPALKPAWQGRWRTQAIQADLAALDAPIPGLTAPLAPIPDISTTPALVGSLYVIEGSALGGQVIAADLERKLNLTRGHSYFKGFGPATMMHWRNFKTIASTVVPHHHNDATIAAAAETFDALTNWFQH